MTYTTYVDVFLVYLIRIISKDKLKAAFLKRVNGSTQSELNFSEG